MSTTSTALMTAEELMNLPDDNLCHELIYGELITMPVPGLPHGRIGARLSASLTQVVMDNDLGEVFVGDSGFHLSTGPDTVLGPDISFISKARLEQVEELPVYWQGAPDLAVEVLSPGDRPGYVEKKISLYLSFGTRQVWSVDPKRHTVTVYRSETDTTTFSGSDHLESPDLLPGFRISLDKIFGPTQKIEAASS